MGETAMDHRLRWPILFAAGLIAAVAVAPVAAAGKRAPAFDAAQPAPWAALPGWSTLAGVAGRIAAPFAGFTLPPAPDAPPLVLRERPTVASLLGQHGGMFGREPAAFALAAGWSFSMDSPPMRTWTSMPWAIPVGMTISRASMLGERHVELGAGLRSWQDTPVEHSRRWALGLSMGLSF
jgi:hypothetical protein